MSIADKINRLKAARDDEISAIEEKGVSVADGSGFEDLPDLISQIETKPSGATAETSHVLTPYTFYGASGDLETGTMTNNGAVSKSLNTSTTSYTIPEGYHNGSGKVSISTQTKSATPSGSSQTITPDSGYVLSSVTVAAEGGKTVYTGTITPSVGWNQNSHTVTIDTGVTLTSSDIFFMVPSASSTQSSALTHIIDDDSNAYYESQNRFFNAIYYNGGTSSTMSSNYSYIEMYASQGADSDGNSISAVYTHANTLYYNITIAFSGSNVTITKGTYHSSYGYGGTYRWFLIKS